MNYAIFRSSPIYTLNDLAQIGSHNKREKSAYKSNPDIKTELSHNNIELIPLKEKYVKGFYNLTNDYKIEFEERMKTEREDRKRSFRKMLDDSKNVVADELLFTSSNEFFKDMNKDKIKKWADTCMDFIYKDLGYNKNQVLHATAHMDEKTPHMHCVVVPLIKKYDKRTNTNKYTISKKQYIRDKYHLSELQDKYHKRLTDNGFDLERGIKRDDRKHIKINDYKRITQRFCEELEVQENKLDIIMNELSDKMKCNKEVIFDKQYIKIKKDAFDTMNEILKESKNILSYNNKNKKLYNELKQYVNDYKTIKKQNYNLKDKYEKEKTRNNDLENEKMSLKFDLMDVNRTYKKLQSFIYHAVSDGLIPKKTYQEMEKQGLLFREDNSYKKDDGYEL